MIAQDVWGTLLWNFMDGYNGVDFLTFIGFCQELDKKVDSRLLCSFNALFYFIAKFFWFIVLIKFGNNFWTVKETKYGSKSYFLADVDISLPVFIRLSLFH